MKSMLILFFRMSFQRRAALSMGIFLLLGWGLISVLPAPTASAKTASDQQALNQNIADLKSSDLNTASRAAAELGASGDIRAVEPLIEALHHEDSMMQYSASAALQKIGAPAVPAMIAHLNHDNPEFVAQLVETLGQIGDPRAVEPLCQLLSDQTPYKVRMAIVKALGEFNDPRAIEALIGVMKEKFSAERHLAMEPLVKIGKSALEPLLAQLESKDSDVVRIATTALVKIGDSRAVDRMIEVFKTTDSDAVRLTLVGALGQLTDQKAVPVLIDALTDELPVVRRLAANALGKIGEPAVDQLQQVLKTADSAELRGLAASTLGAIGSEQAAPLLIAALEDQDQKVQIMSAKALGQLDDESAVEPLIQALHNAPEKVTEAAGDALVELEAKAVPLLIERLAKDVANPNAKDNINLTANVLARTCSAAVEPLITLIKETDDKASREAAADVLAQIGKPAVDPVISELLQEKPVLRSTWEYVLAHIGQPALSPVRQLTESTDALQRRSAIAILGDIWLQGAEQPLVRSLADWQNRQLAAKGLDAMEWRPKLASERVHYYMAVGQEEKVQENWEVYKQILLLDFKSGNALRTDYAIQVFLHLGKEDMIPEMIQIMKDEQSRIIAQTFLDCGNEVLRQAGMDFLKR